MLHLRVDGDVAEVRALRDRVLRDPLARAISWPFVPHVTLADSASVDVIEAALTALGRYRATARFDRVHLLREGPGRVWRPMAEAVLGPPVVIGRGGIPLEIAVTDTPDGEVVTALRPFAVTARRDGEEVGKATGSIQGERAVLDWLSVAPEHRRQGIGSHLLASVESLAAREGCQVIVTDVSSEGAAESFLGARGWVPAPAGSRYRRDLARPSY